MSHGGRMETWSQTDTHQLSFTKGDTFKKVIISFTMNARFCQLNKPTNCLNAFECLTSSNQGRFQVGALHLFCRQSSRALKTRR
jgi:hypothetical protein